MAASGTTLPLPFDLSDSESEDDFRKSEVMRAAPAARESKVIEVTREHQKAAEVQRKMNRDRNKKVKRNPKKAEKLKKEKKEKSNFMSFLNPRKLRKRATTNKVAKRKRKSENKPLPRMHKKKEIPRTGLSPNLRDLNSLRREPVVVPIVPLEESQLAADSVNKDHLLKVLTDYYKYHDPIRTQEEIENDVRWTDKYGTKALNERLKKKYNDHIVFTQTPGPKNQRMTLVQNRRVVAESVKLVNKLQAPGIVPMSYGKLLPSTIEENNEERIREALDMIADSQTPEDVRDNLIEFYRIVDPERLRAYERGEGRDFIGEILSWYARYGIKRLIVNLEARFLDIRDDDDSDPGPPPQAPPPSQKTKHSYKDPEFVRQVLIRFYTVFNPGRLERPLDELVEHILKKGVEQFNERLMSRYQDCLYTFEDENNTKWRIELTEKLFSFFNQVDQSQLNAGLCFIIAWAERQQNKEKALNEYLFKKYGEDFTTLNL